MKTYYNELVETLGKIEKEWQKFNYQAECFHKIVESFSSEIDLKPLAEVSHQLDLLEHPSVRHHQVRSTFSDLYFQIFNNGRFLVEILNWWGGQVNVHDHDFSAVQFQIKGNALNIVYDFREENPTNLHGALQFGSLAVRKASIWKEGGNSVVRPGNLDPHGVFHVSAPTTSLLIRTLPTPRLGAQSNYFPNLRAHYNVQGTVQRKKLTALSLLARSSSKEFQTHFQKLLDSQSLSENFFMCLKLAPICFREDNVHLVHKYAQRGENEAKIVSSVAHNNAVDFFKTKALHVKNVTEEEKLIVFAISGSHGQENFDKIRDDLLESIDLFCIKTRLKSFLNKLQLDDQRTALQYLDLLKLSGLLYE